VKCSFDDEPSYSLLISNVIAVSVLPSSSQAMIVSFSFLFAAAHTLGWASAQAVVGPAWTVSDTPDTDR
jgi:hypothetical protein